MKKTAPAGHPIHELIAERWSPRAFQPTPVESAKLLSILEAARWAPSSFNEQPWSFLLARKEDPEDFAKMLGCLMEVNQSWARFAPVLIISVARRNFTYNGKPNRCAVHDLGLASENMILEAVSQGLLAHGMAGIDLDKIRQSYALPENCDPVAAWAVGYPGAPESLQGELRTRELAPRERKDLADFVFATEWGEPAKLVQ
jgi:nitroreductase